MTCEEFLARHSEYLDGRMDRADAARWQAHADRCPRCARYDRVVRQGQMVLRNLPEVEPAPDFQDRLQARLRALDAEPLPPADGPCAPRTSGGSSLAVLSIAALIALIAWSPLLRSRPPTAELTPMYARAPEPEQPKAVFFRSATRWPASWSSAGSADDGVLPVFRSVGTRQASAHGLYSPLLVESSRFISTGTTPSTSPVPSSAFAR